MHVDDIDWEDRFWSKVSPEPMSGCWLWDGALSRAGYGRHTINNHTDYAHRLSWKFINEDDIPQGYDIHHVCENTACVNPDHLQRLTRKEHHQETGLSGWAAIHAAKTHCRYGHEFDGHNGRQRTCSICRRRIGREWSARRRAKRKAERTRDGEA